MPTFITQGRYSQHAVKGMTSHPEDRSDQVAKLFGRFGGRLLQYYVTFGEYDFLIVGDVPDEKAMLSILATAAAGGGVADLKTTLAVSTADARDAFASAANAASQFRSAGQS